MIPMLESYPAGPGLIRRGCGGINGDAKKQGSGSDRAVNGESIG